MKTVISRVYIFFFLIVISCSMTSDFREHLTMPLGFQKNIALIDCFNFQLTKKVFLKQLNLIFKEEPGIVIIDSVSAQIESLLKDNDFVDSLLTYENLYIRYDGNINKNLINQRLNKKILFSKFYKRRNTIIGFELDNLNRDHDFFYKIVQTLNYEKKSSLDMNLDIEPILYSRSTFGFETRDFNNVISKQISLKGSVVLIGILHFNENGLLRTPWYYTEVSDDMNEMSIRANVIDQLLFLDKGNVDVLEYLRYKYN